MLKWITTRLRRDTVAPLERAPETNHTVVKVAGVSSRRGLTVRPMAVVKAENRRRAKVARASRKANR